MLSFVSWLGSGSYLTAIERMDHEVTQPLKHTKTAYVMVEILK